MGIAARGVNDTGVDVSEGLHFGFSAEELGWVQDPKSLARVEENTFTASMMIPGLVGGIV